MSLASAIDTPAADNRSTSHVSKIEVVTGFVLAAILVSLAAWRQEFIGDGMRHIERVVAGGGSVTGEPRWLLHPALLFVLTRPFAWLSGSLDVASAARIVVFVSVGCGLIYLGALRSWLAAECRDPRHRAAAWLLAGSCAPVLALYSDIAEPQAPAALALASMAYGFRRRNSADAERGAIAAALGIGVASLFYQATILALASLPLVTRLDVLRRARVLAALVLSAALLPVTTIAVAVADGEPILQRLEEVARGEPNPLTRSKMGSASAAKYAAALVAGPPQAIVSLDEFTGLPALYHGLRSSPPDRVALLNAGRLAIGLTIYAAFLGSIVRGRRWTLLIAMAAMLALPMTRNQQYTYLKFYLLLPLFLGTVAVRWCPRIVWAAAAVVLALNSMLFADLVERGRNRYAAVQLAYASATPGTCWMTSGWTPPFPELWPGRSVGILQTLATGRDPAGQGQQLTARMRECFCDADAVWTDTTAATDTSVANVARHYGYTAVDLRGLLEVVQPAPLESDGASLLNAHVYSRPDQARICRLLSSPNGASDEAQSRSQ